MPKLCYAGLILSFVSIPIVLTLEINRHPHSQEVFKGNSSLHRSISKLFVQLFSATKDNVAIKDTTTETQVNYAYSALPSDLLLSLLQKSHSKAQYFTGQQLFARNSCKVRSHCCARIDILWGILGYSCRLFCFMCHQVITPSILTAYDISCLALPPSGSLTVHRAVPHIPNAALQKPSSKQNTLMS